ncbi:aromatic amino acid transaminase [Gemmobacter nectariphilus]|uniref:amino acid aminotransferase n=1 Tax=Gemmobacter nectariphilus TaxID=220343 RepID=UPI0004197419|nr:amino acid aminotransferase [Gemmobacter nectariphilus]
MLERLQPQPEDKIIQLMALFRDDPRPVKVDLGVGVYKDATGHTPIMRAVRAAGKRLWDAETTKTYVALAGDPGFHAAMAGLVLGDAVPASRLAAAAAPGGTGALRIAFDLIHKTAPGASVWMSDPTWPNHPAIVADLGLKPASYRYFDNATGGVDFAGMLADIAAIPDGDVLLLHGCCHNPTGANLTPAQWDQLAEALAGRKLTVLIDIAYQGFGDGLEDDAYGTRLLARRLPELLIAASCSKNFGVYRERVGVLLAVVPEGADRATVQANLAMLNRLNYSFPPDHGARLVQTVLGSPDLTADWKAELEEIRLSMLGLRQQLADELRRLTNSDRFDFIARHRGMFSRLGLSPDQVARLRADHAIYMVGDSRINIAGLNKDSVPLLARAIAAVI